MMAKKAATRYENTIYFDCFPELTSTKYRKRDFLSVFYAENYNIPRACLLNRSPVPAMDLKSNKSGL